MKSNYKPIGDYIRPIKDRNNELKVTQLMGINIDKFFMPSVANTVGTDMSKYKVVKNGQFACNRMHVGRDKRLPVALWKGEESIIVSPAYDVFEIIDTEVLDPDYLMMWFLREEFDRNAWFYTDADVRGGLKWEGFCNITLPVPSIKKQKEIVTEFNVLLDRKEINNQLIENLEKVSQTIFKQWFINFEFPDENGNSYKSNGGDLIYNEELDREIPVNWKYTKLHELAQTQYGYTASADNNEEVGPKYLRITDIAQKHINWDTVPHCNISENDLEKYLLKYGDIVIARTGATAGYAKRINKYHPRTVFASYLVRMTPLDDNLNIYLGMIVDSDKYREYIISNAEGSAQPQANANLMGNYSVIKPTKEVILKLNSLMEPVLDQIELLQLENTEIKQLESILLSKLAKAGDSL